MVKNQRHPLWSPLLLEWFRVHRRDLPWRQDMPRDPYKVWVSEIMLQQTKVEAVKPYYEHWLERFPTVASLAEASLEEVLKEWQGLGYYSRARNLHEAVKEVQAAYGGKVPDKKEDIVKLKGIGEYTANAILSIAYGQDEIAVDGNVLRVFARIYNIKDNILSGSVKKQITMLAQEQLRPHTGALMCEALMDFGAMVCIPQSPRCGECPIEAYCQARKAGTEKELPLRITRKKIPTEYWAVAVIRYQGKWLIHQRPDTGLLASMWEFPMAEGRGKAGRERAKQVLQAMGLVVSVENEPAAKLKHVFSHKIWQLTVYTGTVISGTLAEKEDWQWLSCSEYTAVPWAGPHGKLTAMV